MNTESTIQETVEVYQPHWVSRAAFPIITGALILAQLLLGVAVYYDQLWAMLLLLLPLSHLMHGQLIAFHEASHGTLRKNRRLNEIDGILIGTFSFMSFSLYRAAHQTHHMHLGTQRDEELWPFVDPQKPRGVRVLAAVIELTAGILFTPFLFLRSFLRKDSPIRSRKVRRRIWAEFAFAAFVWATVLTTVSWLSGWKYFIWMFLIPAVIAANLQSWRKYIEHVGLTGSTIKSGTRSIVANGPIGRLVSLTLLHEPYHGVHHQRAGIPHAELPCFVADLQPDTPDEKPPFPSYGHALLDLLKSLADPRVGAQWVTAQPGRNNA